MQGNTVTNTPNLSQVQNQIPQPSNVTLSFLKFHVYVNNLLLKIPELLLQGLKVFLATTDSNLCKMFSNRLGRFFVTSEAQVAHDVFLSLEVLGQLSNSVRFNPKWRTTNTDLLLNRHAA
jgi:hypothetical protein